jgi:di/tricarboxylate transporter
MVMGPGGYHFTDYLRVGLPMTLTTAVVVVGLVPLVWSF